MDSQDFYWFLSKIHLVVFGCTILVGIVRFRRLDFIGRLFLLFLFLMFFISSTSFYLANEGTNNLFLTFIETCTVLIFVGGWFSRVFSEQPKKWVAYFLAGLILASILAEIYIFQKTMSEYAALAGCLSVVVCASLGIHGLMADDRIVELSTEPHFWMLVGLLITNAFSSLFTGFRGQILVFSSDLFIQFAIVELLLQICAFLLYTYIFVKRY